MDGAASDRDGSPAGGAGPRSRPEEGEGGTVDRDALHPADYGGRRDTETDDLKQGGVTVDEPEAGGRKPTGERDRDYDPDGDRLGR